MKARPIAPDYSDDWPVAILTFLGALIVGLVGVFL